MYLQKKIKTDPSKPASSSLNVAERARDNQKIGNFIVKSEPGFNIGSYHKFNIFKRAGTIRVEYCQPCSKVRALFNIKGDKLDYVKAALDGFPPIAPSEYNPQLIRESFKDFLIAKYGEVVGDAL